MIMTGCGFWILDEFSQCGGLIPFSTHRTKHARGMCDSDANIYLQGLQQFCYKYLGFNYRVILKCIIDMTTTETWYNYIHLIVSHNITRQSTLSIVYNITLGPYTESDIRCIYYATMRLDTIEYNALMCKNTVTEIMKKTVKLNAYLIHEQNCK